MAADAVAVGARTFWAQLGLWSDEAAELAHEAGLSVVMNRCIKIEHARFAGGLHLAGFDTGVISSKRPVRPASSGSGMTMSRSDAGTPQWKLVDEGWGRKAVDFATLSEPHNCREYLYVHHQLEVDAGDRLLDVACGSGLVARAGTAARRRSVPASMPRPDWWRSLASAIRTATSGSET